MTKISELNGRRFKKELGFKYVIKSYHNKHKDGSGNFGFVFHNGIFSTWFRMDGDHNSNGEITGLWFGLYSEAGTFVRFDTYENMISDIKEIINRIMSKKIAKKV